MTRRGWVCTMYWHTAVQQTSSMTSLLAYAWLVVDNNVMKNSYDALAQRGLRMCVSFKAAELFGFPCFPPLCNLYYHLIIVDVAYVKFGPATRWIFEECVKLWPARCECLIKKNIRRDLICYAENSMCNVACYEIVYAEYYSSNLIVRVRGYIRGFLVDRFPLPM